MKILVLNETETHALLPMAECIEVMTAALGALARGEVTLPLRTIMKPLEVRGVLALMPSFRAGEDPLFGLKAICVFPGNVAVGLDAHQGGVLLFDGSTGQLLAMVNASAITAIRTAAVSGVATRTLARADASTLAIIGAGVQARPHLEAIAAVRQLRSARVSAQRRESAQVFAREMQPRFPFPIEPVECNEAAVRGADIVVTATTAREPVIQRDWISPGTHINAIGTFSPAAREIDGATMASSSLYVDRRESALNEAGDYLIPAREGLIDPAHIKAELGEVLTGAEPGRTSDNEITLFKSLGLGIEDLAAAEYAYRKAKEMDVGTWTEF